MSETRTIVIACHRSTYRNFKWFYTQFVKKFGLNGSLDEVDVETPTAIPEMTVSSSGNTAGQDIISAGAYIVRSGQELIQLMTQLEQP